MSDILFVRANMATSDDVAHLLGGVVIALYPAVVESLLVKAQLWSYQTGGGCGVTSHPTCRHHCGGTPRINTKCSTVVLCWHPPLMVAEASCSECLLRVFIPHHRLCSLITSSHQMPGRETMIPSLRSPRSPLIDPPSLRFPPLKWCWQLIVWISDMPHR
jgi:hypothetical protein